MAQTPGSPFYSVGYSNKLAWNAKSRGLRRIARARCSIAMALRAISRLRHYVVAFGAQRTSNSEQDRRDQSRLTLCGHRRADFAVPHSRCHSMCVKVAPSGRRPRSPRLLRGRTLHAAGERASRCGNARSHPANSSSERTDDEQISQTGRQTDKSVLMRTAVSA
jgi:hypothetical protein